MVSEAEPTVAALLTERAGGSRTGLIFEDREWTWTEVAQAARVRAAWMRGHVAGLPADPEAEPGTLPHLGVLLDNVPEYVFLLGAAGLGGGTLVALNPTRGARELARDAAVTHCQAIVSEPAHAAAAEAIAGELGVPWYDVTSPEWAATLGPYGDAPGPTPPGPGGLVMLIFTSGTTGRPRAVRITDRKIAVPGTMLGPMTGGEDGRVYCPMPLFHSGAVMAAFAPALATGAALVLRRRFSASGTLPDIRRYGCTYLHYVGKALSYVVATAEEPGDADNPLRVAFGNEGSPGAVKRFGERFGCLVIDSFGSTETAITVSGGGPDTPPGALGRLPEGIAILDPLTERPCPPAKLGPDGWPLNAEEAVGELVNTSGGGLFDGYYGEDASDRIRDGRFFSGDLAYADENGFVYFAGRSGDRLRVDGENLSAAPIEELLRAYPGFVEAAVYAVPDPEAGDQVMAAAVPIGPFDPAAFTAFLTERSADGTLGAKWAPRFLRLMAELPQTASHKVRKRDLAAERWHTTDPVLIRTAPSLTYHPLNPADAANLDAALTRPPPPPPN